MFLSNLQDDRQFRWPEVAVCSTLFLFCCISSTLADGYRPGQIHSYPYIDKSDYIPHQLEFETPKDAIARADFKSEEFYAVLLESAEACSIPENKRAEVQKLFANNKVFMDRFNCDDLEENITYMNVNSDFAFIAVHAGETIQEAEALVEKYNLSCKFPGANIRKMQAVLVYP